MTEQNKHHHRKTSKKTKPAEQADNSSRSQARSSRDKEIEEGSKLHLGDTTLQTPEEHKTDAATDQSKTDHTTVTRE